MPIRRQLELGVKTLVENILDDIYRSLVLGSLSSIRDD